MRTNYPCEKCTKVKKPRDCTKKTCQDWSIWFLERWKEFNAWFEKNRASED